MLIEISITLQPATSQDEARKIREDVLDLVRRNLRVLGQEKAIVGSSLSD